MDSASPSDKSQNMPVKRLIHGDVNKDEYHREIVLPFVLFCCMHAQKENMYTIHLFAIPLSLVLDEFRP